MGRAKLAEQLWLDVPGEAQQRPGSVTKSRLPRPAANETSVNDQLELRMVPRAEQPIAPAPTQPRPIAPPAVDTAIKHTMPVFTVWLRSQIKRPGVIGDLAKAAQGDRLFPKAGSADDVRARFSAVGADGDAFEALDYAEREFDRQSQQN